MGKFIDLKGKRFGQLLVSGRSHNNTRKEIIWKCLCDCGNTTLVNGADLRKGHTKSCGCLKYSHRMSNTRPYHIWRSMMQRCYYQDHVAYSRYGGRGIKVSKEWHVFENFWRDMKLGYQANLSLDRIDNDGNYEPENCRWATRKQQQNNMRTNRLLTIGKETKTITQWSLEMGDSYWALRRKARKEGFVRCQLR